MRRCSGPNSGDERKQRDETQNRKMKMKKKEAKTMTCEELFAAGRWTEFLNSLPLRGAKTFKFSTTGQLMTLKVIASQQSRKSGGTRKYSVKAVNYDNLTATIEASAR